MSERARLRTLILITDPVVGLSDRNPMILLDQRLHHQTLLWALSERVIVQQFG